MNYIFTFLLTLPIILACDFLWIGYFAKNFYQKLLTPVINLEFFLTPAFIFYFLYLVGIFIFAVYPGVLDKNIYKTILLGALFGFFCYSTYDLTNMATIKDWPLKLVVVDIVWGTMLTAVVSAVAYKIFFWF
jgi:uncharacterized membrane protein